MISVILLSAAVLRFISVNQSFWLDEATSALIARDLSYTEIINKFSVADFHPPFYYLLLKFWGEIFGVNEIALRSLSIVAGLLTIYITYLIGKEIDKNTGIIAAFLLSINGLHIYYSQEARMYSLSALFAALSFYFFLKTLNKGAKSTWFLFSGFIVLNSFTDYLPNLMLPVFWILGFVFAKDRKWWKSFLLSHIPLITVWLIWLPYFSRQLTVGASVSSVAPLWWEILGKTNLKNVLLVPVKFIIGRISFENKVLYYSFAGLVTLIFASIIAYAAEKKLKTKETAIYLWLLIPLLLAAVLGIFVPIFYYFRFLFVLPAFILVLSYSLSKLSRNIFVPVLIFVSAVSISSSFYYLFESKFHREDWRGAVRFIENADKSGNYAVIFSSGKQTEAYYYYSEEDKVINIDNLNKNYDKVWLVRYVQDIFDPGDNTGKTILEKGYLKQNEHSFNVIIIWEYKNADIN